MEGHQLMVWLRSRWDWIVRNKFLTCIIVFAVGLLVFGVVMVCRHWGWIVTESGSTIIRNLGLVIGGIIALGLAFWRLVVADRQSKAAQEQADTSRRSLMNERYQKGAEMLGSQVLAERLGGIYALHSLAEEDPEQHHIQIMRLLCAFVCHPTSDPDDSARMPPVVGYPSNKAVRQDVQITMWVIAIRSKGGIELEKKVKFGLFLIGADLTCARLIGANLTGALLFNTNLTGAILSKAKGLTQGQLDLARADPTHPPTLDEVYDAETGVSLEWRGRPLGE